MKSAEESILKGNDVLKLCLEKSLNRNAIQQVQALIDMELERKIIDDLKKNVNWNPYDLHFVSDVSFAFCLYPSFVCSGATASK